MRNVSEQLAVLSEADRVTAQDVLTVLPAQRPRRPAAEAQEDMNASLRELTRRRVTEVLACAQSRQEAADMLGISKTTLWRKLKEYDLLYLK